MSDARTTDEKDKLERLNTINTQIDNLSLDKAKSAALAGPLTAIPAALTLMGKGVSEGTEVDEKIKQAWRDFNKKLLGFKEMAVKTNDTSLLAAVTVAEKQMAKVMGSQVAVSSSAMSASVQTVSSSSQEEAAKGVISIKEQLDALIGKLVVYQKDLSGFSVKPSSFLKKMSGDALHKERKRLAGEASRKINEIVMQLTMHPDDLNVVKQQIEKIEDCFKPFITAVFHDKMDKYKLPDTSVGNAAILEKEGGTAVKIYNSYVGDARDKITKLITSIEESIKSKPSRS